MASLIPYTKRQLLQRVRQHLANDFPSAEFSASENEVMLYIDQAIAFSLVGTVWNNAKITGNIEMPEGFITTYQLPALTQNTTTKEWYSTLPQPPVSLPLGYSVDQVFFADTTFGKGPSVFLIKAKRVSYRNNMPMPFGVRSWIEGSRIYFMASDGTNLFGNTAFVRMAATRTEDLDAAMLLPDDQIELVFQNVVAKLKDRMQIPQDVILDDLAAGNKGS